MSGTVTIIQPGPLAQMFSAGIARLRLFFPEAAGYSHRAFPAQLTKPSWDRVTERLPCIAYGWIGADGSRSTTSDLSGVAKFHATLLVKNPAGQLSRLLGDAQGTGLLDMVGVAAAALHGLKVLAANGEQLGTLQVDSCDASTPEEFQADDVAMATVTWFVKLALPLADVIAPVPAGTLDGVAIDWTFDGTAIATLENP